MVRSTHRKVEQFERHPSQKPNLAVVANAWPGEELRHSVRRTMREMHIKVEVRSHRVNEDAKRAARRTGASVGRRLIRRDA